MRFLFSWRCPFVIFRAHPTAHEDHQVHFIRSACHLLICPSVHPSIPPPNGKSVSVQGQNCPRGWIWHSTLLNFIRFLLITIHKYIFINIFYVYRLYGSKMRHFNDLHLHETHISVIVWLQ